MTSGYTVPEVWADNLLDLLHDDPSPLNVDHVTAITAAILVVGETTPGGHISPNEVRALLRRTHGFLPSSPRIGPTYRALVKAKQIARDGWEISDDRESRNAGRMVPAYRLLGGAA